MATFYQAKDSGVKRNNFVQVGLHVVWTTQQRMPMVRSDMEEAIYRCITSEAERVGASVIAVNGMPDHIHVLLLLPTTVTIARLVQQIKGVSSSLARDLWPEHTFHWAKGYGVFAVSRTHLEK
ncbi:MAG: IS200/IS605 family transposase [Armatimonas sp.]